MIEQLFYYIYDKQRNHVFNVFLIQFYLFGKSHRIQQISLAKAR